jgi:hypothetical protein
MSMPRWWKWALLWAFSLVLMSALTAAAQARRGVPNTPDPFVLESPTILTGSDVGFRLERVRDGVPVGHVVVRVDGRWVEPQAR